MPSDQFQLVHEFRSRALAALLAWLPFCRTGFISYSLSHLTYLHIAQLAW
jgi:hypothetical protein